MSHKECASKSPQLPQGDSSDPAYQRSVLLIIKSPLRQLGDGSDPAYQRSVLLIIKSPLRQLGDGSDPTYEEKRGVDRLDLNHPPAPAGGFPQLDRLLFL